MAACFDVAVIFSPYTYLLFTRQSFLRISGFTKICNKKITFQCIIFIVPEEGWFGQPKYSTHIKTLLNRRTATWNLLVSYKKVTNHNKLCLFQSKASR